MHGETFNIGFETHSISAIADMVKKVVEEEIAGQGADRHIDTTPSNDNRSYHVNSNKIRPNAEGYRPKRYHRGRRARSGAWPFRNGLVAVEA